MFSRTVPLEQHAVLQHKADLGSQGRDLVVSDIYAVDENPSERRIVKAWQQAKDGGFARTRGANDADDFSRPNVERDFVQDRVILVIPERHPVEGDPACDPAGGNRIPSLFDHFVGRKNRLDAFQRQPSSERGYWSSRRDP